MPDYVRALSTGEIVRSTFEIYGKNFISIFLIYFLPLFPATILLEYAKSTDNLTLAIISFACYMLMIFVAVPAITISVSDICTGNKPSLARSYRRAFGKTALQYFWTSLLVAVFLVLGYICLVIPGIIFSLWYMFALQVVVLERASGMNALRRSKELGKSFYLRNFWAIIVVSIVMGVIGFLLGTIFGLIFSSLLDTVIFGMFVAVIRNLSAPLSIIAVVLMYYDMRVRKEAYNLLALEEELRH